MELPPKKRALLPADPQAPAPPAPDPGAAERPAPRRPSKIEGVAPYRRPRVGPQYQATLPKQTG